MFHKRENADVHWWFLQYSPYYGRRDDILTFNKTQTIFSATGEPVNTRWAEFPWIRRHWWPWSRWLWKCQREAKWHRFWRLWKSQIRNMKSYFTKVLQTECQYDRYQWDGDNKQLNWILILVAYVNTNADITTENVIF